VAGQGATTRSLRPGDWEDVELFWQLAGPAGAAASAAVDPRNVLRECDETDNSVNFQVTESVLPDLTIPAEGVTLPATVSGQIAQVSVRVENHGSARSVGGVLRLHVGPPSLGAQGGQAALPEIAPGQGATVQVAWDTLGLAGTQVLYAVADPEGDVLEGNDTNNTATREVTLAAPTRPDPAVESLSIVPSPAAIGAPVQLSAEVVNRGLALPNGFVLSFRLNSGEVARITSAEALPSNARRTVQHTLQTLSLQGRQLVEAVADPANAMVEQNEGNNRQTGWLDLAGAGLSATLRTDRVSYRSNETATLTVTVQNSGEPRAATLRVYVNDSFGNLLATIIEQPLALPAGSSTSTHGWSTGATPPGTYSAVADLALDGTVVSRAVSPFSILGDRSASAVLYSDRGEYEPGQGVVLSGRLRNSGVNQTLVNLQAKLTVQAPDGATVFTSSRAIQVFAPGAEETVGGTWNVANEAPGVYTARLELRESSTALLSFASLPVTVLDSGQTGAGLSGSLAVSPDPVGSGAPLLARFTAQNGGNADMSALRLRVRLLRVSDGEAVASREIPWPLARNQQRGGSLTFPTGGLPEGEYRAVLEGLLPSREVSLGSAPFNAGRGVSVADVTLAEGNAGTSQAVFEVSLSSASEGEVRVGFRTVDGTAVAGEDYEEATGTLVFPPGERRQTVTVNVLGDTLAEAEEVFLLELTEPVGVLLGDAQALGVLTDEEGCASPDLLTNGGGEDGTADSDLPAWTAAAGNWQRRLGDPVPLVGNASLVAGGAVDRAELWQEADLAPFASHIDGPGLALAFESFVQSLPAGTPDMARILIEFRDATGAVLETWDSGETGSPGAWQAVVAARTAPAGTRRVRVRLTAIRHGQEPIGVAFDRVALRSLGVPVLSADGVELTEGNSGSREARFALRLSCPAPADLDVSFATVDGSARAGSDYDQASGAATFATGGKEAAVAVMVRGDLADEQDETFTVDLAAGAGVVLLDSRLTGLIQDDDGQVTIAVDEAFVDEAAGARAEITVRLSSPSGKTVTVDYETVAGSATRAADFVTASGTLTFEPGVESLTVAVDIPDDGVDEGDETFEIRLSAPVNAALADGTAAVTIRDGDRAELVISDATVIEGHGTVVDATFLVTLTVPSSREVQVAYATENGTAVAGTDYQTTTGTLTFQPGSTSATVAVRILGNRTPQPDRLFRVRLDAPAGAVLLDPEGEGTIRDDDGVTITIDDRTITEGDSGSADVIFTIRVANHDKTVTVSYATVDGTARAGADYTAVNGTLTFDRGKGQLTVTVPVTGDLAEEQVLETFQLRLSNQSAGSLLRPAGTTTIVDNDGWAFNGAAAA
ncbi:MAG TPA: Calx-beta domain-containing protein, partial [Thermoanaerobaculia bacterium]|nr:Calx-beta domain-containing protein [Thermoanaerobaculia bacterium]